MKHDLWVVTKQRFDRQNAAEIEEMFLRSLERIENYKAKRGGKK